jgi:hypothetical protein
VAVRHPARIDGIIFPWSNAIDNVLPASDDDVRALAAIDIDAFRFPKEPDLMLKRKSLRSALTGQISTVFSE